MHTKYTHCDEELKLKTERETSNLKIGEVKVKKEEIIYVKTGEIKKEFKLKNEGKEEETEPEWAYPHPYDSSIDKKRFLDSTDSKYKEHGERWNLLELVKLWEETDGEETWPWVWCLRNPVGPHHLFIGVSENTLELARKICDSDRNNNLTIIVNSIEEIEKYAPVRDFYNCRCGVIECPVQQADTENKMLMLKDERIICFDHAYIS